MLIPTKFPLSHCLLIIYDYIHKKNGCITSAKVEQPYGIVKDGNSQIYPTIIRLTPSSVEINARVCSVKLCLPVSHFEISDSRLPS